MSKQINILANGDFQIINTNDKTGKVDEAVTFKAEPALANAQLGRILNQTIKTAGTFRAACSTFLALVYASPRLDGYRGKGDRDTGILSKEFKASVRDAEALAVEQLIEEGAIKLPKGNQEEHLQAFLSGLRDDKNYSNAKNTTNKYFALCGAMPVTSGGVLVPFPVMQAEIAAVVKRAPVDSSFAAMFRAIREKMDGGTIDEDDAVDSLAYARELYETLNGIVNGIAADATAARSGVDNAANAALEKAAAQVPNKEAATV